MKRILILIAPLILIILAFRPVRSITVNGTVTDGNGKGIPFVNVSVKGTKSATQSNSNGAYQITASSPNAVLVFAATGFEAQEQKINGSSTINITLKEVSVTMKEVVVTTALNIKRAPKSVSYSTATVNADQVSSGKLFNASQALSNRVAGLTVYNSPGAAGETRVRGRGIGFDEGADREGYDHITENKFLKTKDNPLSTFSIDVDAASYSNIRRFLNLGQLPPAGAVRIEEMINYFHYNYPQPTGKHPFSINTEISDAPWNKENKLVLINLQGEKISTDNLPPSNLVFLVDVSGSMGDPNKLPLVKASMKMLVDQLRAQDKVSMVVYAGAAGLVLAPTSGAEKTTIKDAIDRLESGGSTAGGAGIKLAYKTANENLVKNGNNRVILCTDGDFNVGESSDDAMERMIEQERKTGVFLTVLGYGMGNYQDAKMQKLADKGNGNHAYIDGISEAKKVLVNEFGGTLFTIAKDVKLQVEFNPAKVQGYRLIGYENRMLAQEDFNDDKKDAGELGSGHTVTALYEIIPVGVQSNFLKSVDSLKYQKNVEPLSKSSNTDEILTVKFRYKQPDGETSKLIEHPVHDTHIAISAASENFRFAAAVAQFGMLLRGSEFRSAASYSNVVSLAAGAKGKDEEGYRSEFVKLVQNAETLAKALPEKKKAEENKIEGTH